MNIVHAFAEDIAFLAQEMDSEAVHSGHLIVVNREPWHWRYVGVPHAKVMKHYDFCLEEYLAFVTHFSFEGPLLLVRENDRTAAEIYYVPATEKVTELPLPQHAPYHLSGNNRDGFVVTVFHGGR